MRHRIIITSFLLILPLAMQLVCRARNIDSTMFLTVGGNRARLYRRILRHLYSLTTGSCWMDRCIRRGCVTFMLGWGWRKIIPTIIYPLTILEEATPICPYDTICSITVHIVHLLHTVHWPCAITVFAVRAMLYTGRVLYAYHTHTYPMFIDHIQFVHSSCGPYKLYTARMRCSLEFDHPRCTTTHHTI